MATARHPDRDTAVRRVRQVLDRLIGDGTAVAHRDGTTHRLFPVAIGAAEGAAIKSWVIRENAARTIEMARPA